MDPSTKAAIVLGEATIPFKELSAEDWHEIISGILRAHKPHLKYLSQFEKLGKLIDHPPVESRYDEREFDKRIIVIPEGINKNTLWNTLCIHVSYEEERKPEDRITRTFLLLTREGQWFLWILDLKYIKRKDLEQSIIKEKVIGCSIRLLDEKSLLHLLKMYPRLGKSIIEFLHGYVSENVLKKQERLNSIENFEDKLWEILERIN